jgi:hypothetical protein
MSSMPEVPSKPVPERIMPIAALFRSSARERMKKLTAKCCAGPLRRGVNLKASPAIARNAFGGMTYTWPGLNLGPDLTSSTGIFVPFAMISVNMLWWLGSRCCTSTNAIPVSAGRA